MRNIFFVLLILITQLGYSQVKGYIGVKGGASLSNTYIEHTVYNTFLKTGFIPGYNTGMVVKLFTKKPKPSGVNGAIHTGIYLEQKGWKQVFETDEPSYHVKMNYLVLPFEGAGYIGKGKTRLFISAGIFLEQLVSYQKDETPDLENIGRGIEFYTYEEDRDKQFGYGIRATLGLQYDSKIGAFHVDGFISYTASSFIETKKLSDRLPDLTNHYLGGFSVAYMIPFGKFN